MNEYMNEYYTHTHTHTYIYEYTMEYCPQSLSHVWLCYAMDYSLPGSYVHEDSPGKNAGVGCHALLQGIFPTQGSNPVSCIAWGFFTVSATREAQEY